MPLDYQSDKRYAHLSIEQVRKHYEVEHELREYLLQAPREERTEAFLWAYDELFRRVPWHPALTEPSGIKAENRIQKRAAKLSQLIDVATGSKVLEIGCGMGELTIGLAAAGYDCCGLDVSEERISRLRGLEKDGLKFIRGTAHITYLSTKQSSMWPSVCSYLNTSIQKMLSPT